ncbi:MAG: hypothetical protein ACH350_05465 [Parachlamydiaceae bacterium]
MADRLAKFLSLALIFSFPLIATSPGVDPSLEGKKLEKPTVILDLVVNPISDRLDSEFKTHQISGKVLLGNNPCEAQGVSLKMRVKEDHKKKGTVHVKAFLTIDQDRVPRMCTKEYRPVYEDFSFDVTAQRVIIHDVDSNKNDVILH